MLSQVIRAMECLFAPFVCTRVFLFRLMAELMSSAVFGSGKNLYGGNQRDNSSAISSEYSPSGIQGAGTHELSCPS